MKKKHEKADSLAQCRQELAESQHPLRTGAFNVVENVVETMMDIQMMIPPKR